MRLRGIFLLLGTALVGLALAREIEAAGGPERIQAALGPSGPLLLVPIHALVAVSPLPSEFLVLGYGAIYGVVWGGLLAWAGWMGAAWIEYALFSRVARDLREASPTLRLPAWLSRLPADHPLFLIGGRLLPFGSHVVNASAGAARVPVWRFTWASGLALLPGSLLVAAAGAGIIGRVSG